MRKRLSRDSQTVTIGTRASPLAIAQATIIASMLRRQHGVNPVLREILSDGDKIKKFDTVSYTGKDLFTKKIDDALRRKEIDIGVHSLKDLPVIDDRDNNVEIAAYPKRENPADVLISKKGCSLADLPHAAKVGTSSIRRAVQLRAVRTDLQVIELHGNVGTRIKKLGSCGLDAIVLAKSGLKRLGYARLGIRLPFKIMLPAAGQGCLAVCVRKTDLTTKKLVKPLDDANTRIAATAERAFSKFLGGGCNTPIAALAVVAGDTIRLDGLVELTVSGQKKLIRGCRFGSVKNPRGLGRALAAELKSLNH